MPPDVLVADHEPEVGEMSRRYLARAGLGVRVVASPAVALSALAAAGADLFVIDLTMPGLEAGTVRRVLLSAGPGQSARAGQFTVAAAPVAAAQPGGPAGPGAGERHRAAGGLGPVVYLLDRHGVRPRSLSDGLDYRRQFLTRPFSPRALVDAVTELLSAGGQARARAPGHGGPADSPLDPASRLDGARRTVRLAGREVELTRTEFALIVALARRPDQPLSRQRLLAALEAERGKRPTPRAIDVYITQLRAKLGNNVIRTVHSVGYALCWPDEDQQPQFP
jgi:DNA-binding response OmpR family regulator